MLRWDPNAKEIATHFLTSPFSPAFSFSSLLLFFTLSFPLHTSLLLHPSALSLSLSLSSLSQTLTPVSIPMFCSALFFISRRIALCFRSDPLMSFLWTTSIFFFVNHPVSFIFTLNFRHSCQEIAYVFRHTPLWNSFPNEFYYPFHCFNWNFHLYWVIPYFPLYWVIP